MQKVILSIENIDKTLGNFLSHSQNIFFSCNNFESNIQLLNSKIKKEFTLDYSKKIKFRKDEKSRLEKIYVDYLIGKSDDFNSHYIQLLAWYLLELKLISKKDGTKVSIFEYSPNPFAPYTVIEKTFRLFLRNRTIAKKVSIPLILLYLNNYKISSNRFKRNLHRYLSFIRFSKDNNIYFFTRTETDLLKYSFSRTKEFLFHDRMLKFGLSETVLTTNYFTDAWFYWMYNEVNLTNEESISKNLNSIYFNNCSLEMKKILFAKIIRDCNLFLSNFNAEKICNAYIFPVIKSGNPFTKEFWNLNISGNHIYLNEAWMFIEKTFVNNPYYRDMIDNLDKK